jgi:uncharacterized protein GlcG (DUF336 family)
LTELTLEKAQSIIAGTLAHASEMNFMPMGVAVLDNRGVLKAYAAQDGTSLFRYSIANAKAHGAVGMGFGSSELARRVAEKPHFLSALNAIVDGGLIAAPGGVLIKDSAGKILGAVGVSGDVSHNDEACAVVGIEAAGFVADSG